MRTYAPGAVVPSPPPRSRHRYHLSRSRLTRCQRRILDRPTGPRLAPFRKGRRDGFGGGASKRRCERRRGGDDVAAPPLPVNHLAMTWESRYDARRGYLAAALGTSVALSRRSLPCVRCGKVGLGPRYLRL